MRDPRTLDLDCDRVRIIHHVLAYGSLEDWRWLRRTYPLATIRRVFREHPLKVHTAPSFYFASQFLLRVRPPRYADRYLASLPRRAR